MTTINITEEIIRLVKAVKDCPSAYALTTREIAANFPAFYELAGVELNHDEYLALPGKLQAATNLRSRRNFHIAEATIEQCRQIVDAPSVRFGSTSRSLAKAILAQLPPPPNPYVITVTNPDGDTTGTIELTPDEAEQVSGTWHGAGTSGAVGPVLRGKLSQALRA